MVLNASKLKFNKKNSFQGTPLRDTDRFPGITTDSNASKLTYIVNELSKPTVVKVPMN